VAGERAVDVRRGGNAVRRRATRGGRKGNGNSGVVNNSETVLFTSYAPWPYIVPLPRSPRPSRFHARRFAHRIKTIPNNSVVSRLLFSVYQERESVFFLFFPSFSERTFARKTIELKRKKNRSSPEHDGARRTYSIDNISERRPTVFDRALCVLTADKTTFHAHTRWTDAVAVAGVI